MKTAKMQTNELGAVVAKSDSGTWGDEGTNGEGSPVLRSTNIVEGRMNLAEPAWRVIPENDRERRRLASGDIIVTKSSGSPDHIGKCAVFHDPNDGHSYYFSNFMLRLRADERKLHWRWLYYWLSSDRGRYELQKFNSTTTGLRNLSVPQYMAQEIPLPPLSEQRRIADILDKADGIRRKRREVVEVASKIVRSAYMQLYGDPVANHNGWPIRALGEVTDMLTGFAFKSGQYTANGVRLCRGANVLPDRIDWSDLKYWRESDPSIDPRLKLEAGDVVLAMDRPWISTGIKVAQITDADVPAYLVQRVSRLRSNGAVPNAFIYYTLRHPAFTAHCGGLKTETTVPHISPTDIRNFQVPVAPRNVHDRFERIAKHAQSQLELLRRASDCANQAFSSLVQRAFRGDL